MRIILSLVYLTAKAVAAVPYQEYVLAPSSRTVLPVAVFQQHGSLTSPDALLVDNQSSGGELVLKELNASVTYDFGKNIAGLVNLDISSSEGHVGVTFSESSLWVSSFASDTTADTGSGLDVRLEFMITQPGTYEAPPEKERGGFRYLTVVNLGNGEISVRGLSVYFRAMPHWEDDGLRDYTGWFHSNDDKLNRVWYAGAYTNQLVTIDPTRGDSLDLLYGHTIVNGTLDWWVNTTISEGTSVVTDGAKRDRIVYSGDMSVALPSIAVSTFDMVSVQNALDSLVARQNATGILPYGGYPLSDRNVISYTYHLHGLIGIAGLYHWTGDKSYLDNNWAAWKAGMQWAAEQIDSTGLAYIRWPADWLRAYLGGHNIEANSILYHALNLGVSLARIQGDDDLADKWANLASGIQSAAMSRLWQPSVGLFRDNETTTLAPQDGNVWAIKSGLVSSPSQVIQMSQALQERWSPYGPPAPEAGDAVSPFISSVELESHFLANRTDAALSLIRSMWADFMLDDPRMTNSTFVEGYSTTGMLHYAPYSDDARVSFAHGWATGPTYSLTTYVAGIQLLSDAGATWIVAPQLGDLSNVDAGFSTTKGLFSSKWSADGSFLRLQISTPEGTKGSIGIPIPAGHTKAILSWDESSMTVQGDATGRHWLNDVDGGDYSLTVTGA
ncbi:Six-hairpin glycosidase [Daedaleopsis nitida]|nr:Six-hairpin glycosidase [Daedaleopsis nitida]